jgi:hypothetical protein
MRSASTRALEIAGIRDRRIWSHREGNLERELLDRLGNFAYHITRERLLRNVQENYGAVDPSILWRSAPAK